MGPAGSSSSCTITSARPGSALSLCGCLGDGPPRLQATDPYSFPPVRFTITRSSSASVHRSISSEVRWGEAFVRILPCLSLMLKRTNSPASSSNCTEHSLHLFVTARTILARRSITERAIFLLTISSQSHVTSFHRCPLLILGDFPNPFGDGKLKRPLGFPLNVVSNPQRHLLTVMEVISDCFIASFTR